MSETLQFSSNDIKSWLENETSSVLTPVQEEAKKLRDDMRDAIETVTDVSKMLLENSAKEIEKRPQGQDRARQLHHTAK